MELNTVATPCNKGSAENSFYLIIRNEKLLIKVLSHVKKKNRIRTVCMQKELGYIDTPVTLLLVLSVKSVREKTVTMSLKYVFCLYNFHPFAIPR